jgi:hypothetical protein
VNDGAASQVKEIFAEAALASTSSLPMSDMRQRMFNGDPFS